jgi:hypothetical protein
MRITTRIHLFFGKNIEIEICVTHYLISNLHKSIGVQNRFALRDQKKRIEDGVYESLNLDG